MGIKLAHEVTGVNPKFGRRSWVKLWVNEWLDGTTRFEMSDVQRAFWIDLLAMAGRSRYPGRICAGLTDGIFVGYPLNKFQALMAQPIDVEQTLALFERTGKIKLTVTTESPTKLVMLELLNWDKYQSEYQRQKKYRKHGLHKGDSGSYNQSNNTEVEVEGDVEVKETHTPRVFSTPNFERFWEAYPYKIDKVEANKIWFRIPFVESQTEKILAGLEVWKASDRWREERFVPSPVKFLSNRRWETLPPKKAGSKSEKTKQTIERIRANRKLVG